MYCVSKRALCRIWALPVVALFFLMIMVFYLYDPEPLQLSMPQSTYFVTSNTPNAGDNYFYSEKTEISSMLLLKNCTIQDFTLVGLVEYSEGTDEDNALANQTMYAIFDELNEAYVSAQEYVNKAKDPNNKLIPNHFPSSTDLDDYVKHLNYQTQGLCFAFEWNEFDTASKTFNISIRFNQGTMYSTRLAQDDFEDSLFSQSFLTQQGHSGLLQAMASVTNQVILNVYGDEIDTDYKFQVLHMPMDTDVAYNDMVADCISVVLPLIIREMINIGDKTMRFLGDPNEKRIHKMLKRFGMRKSVELYIDHVLTYLHAIVIVPFVLWIASTKVGTTTSYLVYVVSVWTYIECTILSTAYYKFVFSEEASERIEHLVEIFSIILAMYGVFVVEINPFFVYIPSLILPFNFLTWTIKLSIIASNRKIDVQLGNGGSTILPQINYDILIFCGLIQLAWRLLSITYFWPSAIINNPRNPTPPCYLFRPSFYRNCCRSQTQAGLERFELDDDSIDSGAIERAFSYEQPNVRINEAEEPLRESIASSEGYMQLRANRKLHEDERAMIEAGTYEPILQEVDTREFLQVDRLTMEEGGKELLNHFSLTCFKDQIFVLLGKNGSGKSTLISTLSGGEEEIEGGTARAFGMSLIGDMRFRDDFFAVANQEEVLAYNMSVEQHIQFICRFRMIPNEAEIIKKILTDYDLLHVAKICAHALSKSQRKKLSVALALIGNASIVMLDSPTVGMDLAAKHIVWREILKIKKDRIVIVTTNDMHEAKNLADRVGIIEKGKLAFCGSWNFFEEKTLYGPKILCTFDNEHKQSSESERTQIEDQVIDLVQDEYRKNIEFQWVGGRELAIYLPYMPGNYRVPKVIDYKTLCSKVGTLFRTVALRRASLEDKFVKAIQQTKSLGNRSPAGGSERSESSGDEEAAGQPKLMMEAPASRPSDTSHSLRQSLQVTDVNMNFSSTKWSNSFRTQLDLDFRRSVFLKLVVKMLFVILFALGQESVVIIVYPLLSQIPLNFSNISSIFQDQTSKPDGMVVLANEFLATEDTQSTASLIFDAFVESQNSECEVSDAIKMYYMDWCEDQDSKACVPKCELQESVLNCLSEFAKNINTTFGQANWNATFGEVLPEQDRESATNSPFRLLSSFFGSGGESEGVEEWENQEEAQGDKGVYGAYYLYDYQESPKSISIGVYGNQIGAGSNPTFGASMLEQIARDITGYNDLKINLNYYPLKQNAQLQIVTQPGMAEVYGVALIGAIYVLMKNQTELHGKPIYSGYYDLTMLRGGCNTSYLLSKYLRDCILNLLLATITFVLFIAFKIKPLGYWPIGLLWVLANPLYIYFFNYMFVYRSGLSYNVSLYTLEVFYSIGTLMCLLIPGIYAYGNDSRLMEGLIFLVSLPMPFTIFCTSLQISMLYRIINTIYFQDYTPVVSRPMNPLKDFRGPVYRSFFLFLTISAFYGAAIYIFISDTNNGKKERCCKRKENVKYKSVVPIYMNEEERHHPSPPCVFSERERVKTIKQGSKADQEDYMLLVQEMQCFRLMDTKMVHGQNLQSEVIRTDFQTCGVYSVKGVSFAVKKGERFVILGSNSCGATSVIQSIIGRTRIISGEVTLDGEPLASYLERNTSFHNLVGFQPQHSALDPDMTVREHLVAFARLGGLSETDAVPHANNIMAKLELVHEANEKASELSEGFKRRLSLALALIGRPKLILLDEPLANLDPYIKPKVLQTIIDYSEGRTLIMSTQEVGEAEYIADRIAVMHRAKFVAIGSSSQLLKNNTLPYILDMHLDRPAIARELFVPLTGSQQAVIRSVADARALLRRLKAHYEEQDIKIRVKFDQEFSADGMLNTLYRDLVSSGEMRALYLMERVCVLNLALSLKKEFMRLEPPVHIEIDHIYESMIQFTLDATYESVHTAQFREDIKAIMKACFCKEYTLTEMTLDRFVSDILEQKSGHSHTIAEEDESRFERTESEVFTNNEEAELMRTYATKFNMIRKRVSKHM